MSASVELEREHSEIKEAILSTHAGQLGLRGMVPRGVCLEDDILPSLHL